MRLTASFLIGKKTKWKQNGDSGEPLKLLKEKKKRKKKLNPEFYAQCKLSFTNGGKIKTF